MPTPPVTKARLRLEPLEARENPAAVSITGVAADHVLVTFDPATTEAARSAELSAPKFTESVTALGFGIYKVDLDDGADLQKAITYFAGQPGVTLAEGDAEIALQQTPNDPALSSQWGLSAISAAAGWNVTTGTGHTIVAVIDTGIDLTHPDLVANLWTNPDKTAADRHGYDFANNDNDPTDDNGHGTHVAGIIGATGNNGVGVSGVDQHVQLMALKFMTASGGGYTSDAIRAIDYAVSHGAKIINNSWGGSLPDASLSAAIARARSAGVIFVVAAGNSSANDDTTATYPVEYSKANNNVVAVAATDQNGRLASFSNYGPTTVDVGAPGNSIYSTLPGGGYGIKSGTSMATPFVTGALALLWDLHPTWSYTQIIAKLNTSVDAEATLKGKTVSGGRLNLAKLLDATATSPVVPPVVSPPVASPPVTSPPVASPPTTGGPVLRWSGSGPRITNATFSGSSASNFTTLRLTFDKKINVPTLTADDVILRGPNGPLAVTGISAVAGSNNSVFDVTFAAQTAKGTYSATIGPDVWDTTAQRMDQDGDGVNGEAADRYAVTATLGGATSPVTPSPPPAVPPTTPAPGTRTTYAAPGLPIAIADLKTTRVTFTVTDPVTVAGLKLTLGIAHDRPTDLNIRLRGPDNTLVTLYNRNGSSLANATFDSTTTPGLSAYTGKLAKGTWTVEIFDLASGATGTVKSATLSFAAKTTAAAKEADAEPPATEAFPFHWSVDLFRHRKSGWEM